MRILHLADLHLEHDWFDWVASQATDFDLLVIAGDLMNAFSNTSTLDQAQAISQWLQALPTPTVVCSGNHDYWASDNRFPHDALAEGGWIKNLKGSGQIIGTDGDTFSYQGLDHSDPWLRIAVNGWGQTPAIAGHYDIIVTHAPPAGSPCATGAEGHDVGDPYLWPALQYNPPRLVLSGHIHAPLRHACKWPPMNPTTLVLVPGCDEQSEVPAHWIIDTQSEVLMHSSGVVHSLPHVRPQPN